MTESDRITLLRVLALLSLAVLVATIPGLRTEYIAVAALCAVLTAAAKYFAVILSQGEISTAFMVGILAVLLLPAEAMPTLTWGIFAGGAAGSALRAVYPQRRPRQHHAARLSQSVVMASTHVTFSFVIASAIYRAAGGRQPVAGLMPADALPLLLFTLGYLTVYLGIFLLTVLLDNRSPMQTVRENRLLLALVLLVPAPLVILSTEFYDAASSLAYLLLLAVLVPVTLGLHWFSRLHNNLLLQMREIQALANVSQAVRANQNLDALLETVYREINGLLQIDHFTAVLCDSDGRLHFPLVVRGGQRVSLPSAAERPPDSLIEHVLRTQAPLLLAHHAPHEAWRLGLAVPDYPAQAWLGVPLLLAGRVLGVLEVASASSGIRFGAQEQRVLNIMASAASASIDNARLYMRQSERAARLGNLNTVLALLTETLSPDDVLDTVISSASAVSEATAISVYRYREGAFVMVRCAGLSDDFTADPVLVIQADAGPDGFAQPVVIANAATDARAKHLASMVQRERKAAWIELPLMVGGQGVGVIILYFDTPQAFAPEEIELLRAFANQAAQAIRNADLYAGTYRALENRIEQLSTLAALGRSLMMTTHLGVIARQLLEYALDATSAAAGVVLLRDDEAGRMRAAAEHGYPPGTFASPVLLEQGITGRVLREGQAARCDSAPDEKDFLSLLPGMRSQLSIPVIWQGDIIGAITLESPRPFSAEQSDFVEQLVNQTVFAFENARLFQRVAEGRDRMQAILNTMTEGLILIDRHEQVALANPRVDILGLESHDLVGKDLNTLLDDADLLFAERLGFQSGSEMRRMVEGLRALVVRAESDIYNLPTDAALRYIRRQLIPVRDEQADVIGVLLVFNDETEAHNLERAREEFSQLIIHDLRSPLTAVTSSVSLLSEMIPPENEFSALIHKTAGSSQRAIRKLLNRVDSLLDISRMKSGQMSLHLEVAQLGPLVDNVCAELEPLAREMEIVLTLHLPDNPPWLLIDPEKIERVLLNLVDNALKFSPRATPVMIRMQEGDGQVRVEVIDSGPGIPEAERQTIFDRFVQIQNQPTRSRRGSGLGLNFCKLAVEAHGGRIWIEANPGGGSIFAFTLPLANTSSPDE
jgi:NtrC-family two-component system sensor histidine kinase KinB